MGKLPTILGPSTRDSGPRDVPSRLARFKETACAPFPARGRLLDLPVHLPAHLPASTAFRRRPDAGRKRTASAVRGKRAILTGKRARVCRDSDQRPSDRASFLDEFEREKKKALSSTFASAAERRDYPEEVRAFLVGDSSRSFHRRRSRSTGGDETNVPAVFVSSAKNARKNAGKSATSISSFSTTSYSHLDVSRAILLGLLAMSLFCIPIHGVPMPPSASSSQTDSFVSSVPYRFGGSFENGVVENAVEGAVENAIEDAFEDVSDDEGTLENDLRGKKEYVAQRRDLDEDESEIVIKSVLRGLGLGRIPDPSKANVSQAEYERAHREYLKRVRLSSDEQESRERRQLHVFHDTAYPGNASSRNALETSERRGDYRRSLFFPLEVLGNEEISVEHATLRLFLESSRDDESSDLDVLLYLKTTTSREPIARRTLDRENWRDSRWLELDSTAAVSSWIENSRDDLGLELEFLRGGQTVRRTFSSPVLNVFTVSESRARGKRSTPEELMSLHKGRRTKCKGENKKCCRHELTVMFKDLKGFEFIVYPKTFDAGYCKGRCPPRYNPAHHHALLQSLLWKEDRKKVPKPCCAPSKLDQLMIVYFDENDSTQLKVSYWKNIQVLECACS